MSAASPPPRAASDDWLARSRRAVWHPCTQMKVHESLPIVPIARGEGAWLVDFDGRRYLDAVSSWWVNLFGHCHPRINAALEAQLRTLEHVMLAGFTHAPVVELSERLAALAPRGLGHAFYGSDGASATEIALKMSFHYWRNAGRPRKRRFASLEHSYHGETLGALAVTDVALFRDVYAPLLREPVVVASPDARRASEGESARDVAERAARALEARLAAEHDTIAALIVEPLVQGATGMAMYDAHYLVRARELCTRYGVQLIADEIMTGFGRTGTLFAWEQVVSGARGAAGGVVEAVPATRPGAAPAESAGTSGRTGSLFECERAAITPDFLLLSKGITGGYLPLSCVLTTDDVYEAFYADDVTRGFLHSHSYTGNALACRAALAVLDIFRDEHVIAANRDKAERFTAMAAPLASHPKVRHFRHLGMIWAFDVDSARDDFARWCFGEGLARNVLLRPIGSTIYFMPPYVIRDDEFAHLVAATQAIVDDA